MTLDLRSLGIGIQTSFENAPRDYELLYVSKDLAYVPVNAMDKIRIWEHNLEADKIRAGLPKRIVVGGAVNLSRRDALCALTNSCLDPPQDANSILQVYDEWIQFLLERRDLKQVNLSFFFEWLQTAATHWKQVNQRKPCYVSELIPKSGGPDVVRNGMLHHAKAITLWRHISLREFFENVIQPNGAHSVVYYQECTYGDPFFAYLSAVNPQAQAFQAQYLFRQIIEMALCRVVIIDERIAQTVEAKTDPNELGKSLAHILAWMGIWVVGSVEFKRNGQTIRVTENGQEIDAVFRIGAEPTQQNGLVKLIMDFNEERQTFQIKIEYPRGMTYFPDQPSKIEILTIHQTIVDGKFKNPLQTILEDGDQWKESWILGLKPQVLFVYSHSGRGHPRELLPKNAPFLEYSFLQTHILSRPSKFFFVQLALGSKE